MGGQIDIEADDTAQFVDEARVGGKLELFYPARLQVMGAPDALNGTRASDLRHRGGGSVGSLRGRRGPGERHDAFSSALPSDGMRAGRVLDVQEARHNPPP